ncbi:MAG: methyltransferase [Oscillospiraceae bacterium]|nr:methyltransferase [Oscillospiraceae bacterium]
MFTLRENAMAIYNRQQPDFYGDLMDAIEILPDPVLLGNACPQDGLEHKDMWGTTYIFKPGAPGAHPHVTAENAVIKDIEHWQDDLVVPPYEGLDWSLAKKAEASVDRHEKFVGIMFGGGLFERSHHLMGMEAALCNYLEYPEEMADLLRVIADYKIGYIREMAKQVHPDIIFYHDDWGSKQNVFLPPRVWREIIKPLQQEISDAIHESGMIYMHHADCICQPIVTDMVELGIDIWQGVIAQNDIVEIQRITEGKLAMVGGIDGPKVDIEGISEEAIRAEVRRAIDSYCPAGRFYPSIPNGVCFRQWNDSIVKDELKKYGREFAQKHPI